MKAVQVKLPLSTEGSHIMVMNGVVGMLMKIKRRDIKIRKVFLGMIGLIWISLRNSSWSMTLISTLYRCSHIYSNST
jgi:hypothetical protein